MAPQRVRRFGLPLGPFLFVKADGGTLNLVVSHRAAWAAWEA